MEEQDESTLEKIIASKKHHLLKNDRQDILIFGDDMAVRRLATTHVIHADGTFKCILPDYAQLDILHATVENNVSLPLFCLVKGKNKDTYEKLLGMVEELANEADLVIFNREVQLMCDFDLSLINADQQRYAFVKVKCCFFHNTQSVLRNSRYAVDAVKKAAGQNAEKASWRRMRSADS